jgi:hypothetical protein
MVDGRGFETVNSNNMSDRLRSMLTRLAAYVGVMVAAGLLLLAALSVYQMMWPKPVVPLGRWVIEKKRHHLRCRSGAIVKALVEEA